MRKLMLLLAAALCLVACHDDDDPTPSVTKTSRTVLVYMSGDNNLTNHNGYHYLLNDLREIVEGSKLLSDDQRMLVFVDSMGSYSKTPKAAIIEVHGGQTTTLCEFQEPYASDPGFFRSAVKWMTDNAPADSYGLVLWGHANGWLVASDSIATSRGTSRAYGMDNGEGMTQGERWMNITQMAKALEGLPKLEFIFADCCNMMCAEVGYELRNVTNYLIGSPAEIPGNGAPYNKIMPYLFKNGSELYRGIIDTYYNYYLETYGDGTSVPLSVMETQYMPQLAQATHDVMDSFTDYPHYPEYPELKGTVFYLYHDAPIMYDMKAVIKRYASVSAYEQWLQAFNKAVPYYRMSMEWLTIYDYQELAFPTFDPDTSLNGCVSMFIPRNTNIYNSGKFRYNHTYKNMGWNRVIDWSRMGWE